MAITAAARTQIIKLTVAMFDAAPGANNLSDFVNFVDAGGTISSLATTLDDTAAFKSIYPDLQTSNEFAVKFIDNLVGTEVAAADKLWAVGQVEAALNAGSPKGQVMLDIMTALEATTNPVWANGKAAFTNQVDVATWYSVDQNASGASLTALQAVTSVVTSDAATVTAAKATPPNSGGNFSLTTGVDTITGSAGNDTIIGGALAPDGTTAASTLNALDTIDGGAGIDTLLLDTTGNQNAITGTVTNVENLELIGSDTSINANAAISGASYSGNLTLRQTLDTAVAFTGLTGQKLVADRVVDATTITGAFDAAQTSSSLETKGASDDVVFSVSGTGLKSATLAVGTTNTGKSVTVTDTGNTTTDFTVDATGKSTVAVNSTGLKNIVVKGAGAVTLTAGTAPTTSVDASASTGGLTLGTALAVGASFTGSAAADTITAGATTKALAMGAGDDAVTLTVAALGAGGSIDGGAGTDTLSLTAANAATATSTALLGAAFQNSVANFEKLGVGATGATNTVIDATYIDGINHLISAGTGTGTLTVNNLAANATFESTALQGDFVTLNLKDSTGTADTVNLKFSATNGFTSTAAMTIAAVETLNITTDDTDTTAPTTVFTAPITATAVKSVVVAGDVGINLTGLTATTITSFDASGVTATGAAGAVTNVFGALAADAVIKGGAGNDSLNAAAAVKAVNLDGGAGDDVLTGSSTKVNTIAGGEGADTITGGSAVDTITGGAGADIIDFGTGLDIVSGGAGNDRFDINAVSTNGNTYATISDFTAGDSLDFVGISQGTIANVTDIGAAVTLAPTAAFADFLNASTAGNGGTNALVTWFQYNGDTYVSVDNSAANTFQNGVDSVIKLTGLIDLTNADLATEVLTL